MRGSQSASSLRAGTSFRGRYRPQGGRGFALFEQKSGAGMTNESGRGGKGGSGPAQEARFAGGLRTGVLGAAEPADGAGAPGHSRHPPRRLSRRPRGFEPWSCSFQPPRPGNQTEWFPPLFKCIKINPKSCVLGGRRLCSRKLSTRPRNSLARKVHTAGEAPVYFTQRLCYKAFQ